MLINSQCRYANMFNDERIIKKNFPLHKLPCMHTSRLPLFLSVKIISSHRQGMKERVLRLCFATQNSINIYEYTKFAQINEKEIKIINFSSQIIDMRDSEFYSICELSFKRVSAQLFFS